MPRLKPAEKEPSEAQKAAYAAGAERLKNAREQRKITPVRKPRQYFETEEHKVGQDSVRRMKSRGPAREALEPTIVEPVDRPVSKEKLAMLAFMEEELTVMVHESTNPFDDPFPKIQNGGDRNTQYFIRGEKQKVKRKYVEVLARAKKTTRGNEKYKDGNGDDAYRYPSHTALMYPFVVIEDPNPRGRAWLEAILQEG